MKEKLRLAFIGAGHLAHHLAPAFENAGHKVLAVNSRSTTSAQGLLNRLYEAEICDLDFHGLDLDMIFLTVPDDQIASISQLIDKQAILVHCSGAKPLSAIQNGHEQAGVFYPIQTFRKDKKLTFEHIPIGVEGTKPAIQKTLLQMARVLSKQAFVLNSNDRAKLHMAAVFASNFTNHMFTIAADIMNESKLDFSLLAPLLEETVHKAVKLGPHQAITGPAVRGDLRTLDFHHELLASHKNRQAIYRFLSQEILDYYADDQ